MKVRINDQRFCIPLSEIGEVFVPSHLTLLSQCPRDVSGVVNLRGEIVPIFDPRPALGTEIRVKDGSGGDSDRRAVLIHPDGVHAAALLIDGIEGTITTSRSQFQPLEHDAGGFLAGVLPREEPVILLNVAAFFEREAIRALRH